MSYTRPKFKVRGETFELKPTSPRNVQSLFDYLEDSEIEPDDDQMLLGLGEQYLDVLFLIAEPVDEDVTKDDFDPMDIDINLVDAYMADFLPMQNVTENEQTES